MSSGPEHKNVSQSGTKVTLGAIAFVGKTAFIQLEMALARLLWLVEDDLGGELLNKNGFLIMPRQTGESI